MTVNPAPSALSPQDAPASAGPSTAPRPQVTWAETVGLIKADLRRRLVLEGKPVTLARAIGLAVRPGAVSVIAYRINTWLYDHNHRILARLGHDFQHLYTGSELHVGGSIGPGLVLSDCPGVGIPVFATIGKNCTILGAATLTVGGRDRVAGPADRIVLGDDCILGMGVRVIGAITIASGTQIKPNAVVVKSSETQGAILTGVPARRRGEVPVETMAAWNPLQSFRPPKASRHTAAAATMAEPHLQEAGQAMADRQDRRVSGNPVRQSLSQTLRLVRADIAYRCAYEHKQLTLMRALIMLMHPGVSSVVRYRFQCFFMSNHMGVLGRLLKFLNLVMYGVDIDENARIAGGLYIAHAVSILIVGDVTIGERCALFHQNMICSSPFCEPGMEAGPVVIGNDVAFGGGSCAYGNIVLGDGCKIGVNAVVDRSFPAGSVVFGVPARVIAKAKEQADALA